MSLSTHVYINWHGTNHLAATFTMDTACRSSPHVFIVLCFALFLQLCHSSSQLKAKPISLHSPFSINHVIFCAFLLLLKFMCFFLSEALVSYSGEERVSYFLYKFVLNAELHCLHWQFHEGWGFCVGSLFQHTTRCCRQVITYIRIKTILDPTNFESYGWPVPKR